MQDNEPVNTPGSVRHSSDCPFCAGAEPVLRGLKTHRGSANSSSTLADNLGDKPSYVLPEDLLGGLPGNVAPAAHHIIPGNQAMEPHAIQQYTTTEKNPNLLEDIGYDINGIGNGVWLPTYPDIYKNKSVTFEGEKRKGYELTTHMWAADNDVVKSGKATVLPEEEKIPIVNFIQERWGQAHIGDHKGTGYDRYCKDRLDLLHANMGKWKRLCEKSSTSDGKLNPPYGLVGRINQQSRFILKSIMPRTSPERWTQWVSRYAQDFTQSKK